MRISDWSSDVCSSDLHDGSAPLAIYNPLREQSAKLLTKDFVGDPTATWPAIEAVVDAEDPPLRLILGDMLPLVRQTYESRLQTWEAWQTVAAAARLGRADRKSTRLNSSH